MLGPGRASTKGHIDLIFATTFAEIGGRANDRTMAWSMVAGRGLTRPGPPAGL